MYSIIQNEEKHGRRLLVYQQKIISETFNYGAINYTNQSYDLQ